VCVCVCVGDLRRARHLSHWIAPWVLVRKGLQQRDAAPDPQALSTVTRRLSVGADNKHRKALESFGHDGAQHVPIDTEVVLRDYSLGKVITIATEGAHGLIHIYLKKKVWGSCELLNTVLKAPELERSLSNGCSFAVGCPERGVCNR
jgi:hypothetical protein